MGIFRGIEFLHIIIINTKICIMKSTFHKKLSLKKITISTYKIYGGTEEETVKSSAFHEPTEAPDSTPINENPALISANNETCI